MNDYEFSKHVFARSGVERIEFKGKIGYFKVMSLFNKRCHKDDFCLCETEASLAFSPYMWFPDTIPDKLKKDKVWNKEYFADFKKRLYRVWAVEFWSIEGYVENIKCQVSDYLTLPRIFNPA